MCTHLSTDNCVNQTVLFPTSLSTFSLNMTPVCPKFSTDFPSQRKGQHRHNVLQRPPASGHPCECTSYPLPGSLHPSVLSSNKGNTPASGLGLCSSLPEGSSLSYPPSLTITFLRALLKCSLYPNTPYSPPQFYYHHLIIFFMYFVYCLSRLTKILSLTVSL